MWICLCLTHEYVSTLSKHYVMHFNKTEQAAQAYFEIQTIEADKGVKNN